jgi:hypothetical protein
VHPVQKQLGLADPFSSKDKKCFAMFITRSEERSIRPHPSLKPQSFMRQIVRAELPLGTGVVLDPFMGGGSTIAAAISVGYESIGVELDPTFFKMATQAIPRLADLAGNGKANSSNGTRDEKGMQRSLALLSESSDFASAMPVDADGFDRLVPLPPELKITHIREAIEHVENKTSELIDIYFEQANVF